MGFCILCTEVSGHLCFQVCILHLLAGRPGYYMHACMPFMDRRARQRRFEYTHIAHPTQSLSLYAKPNKWLFEPKSGLCVYERICTSILISMQVLTMLSSICSSRCP
jgi:hypothetical protein